MLSNSEFDNNQQISTSYDILFNAIDDFLFVISEDGKVIDINLCVCRDMGYSQQELVGIDLFLLHPPERYDEVLQIFQAMISSERNDCNLPLFTKDGRYIPVETRVVKGLWQGQSVFFGISKDLTRIKRANERFSKAFSVSPALMAISKIDSGEYIDVNTSFLNALGYIREEVIGRTSSDLGIFSSESRELLKDELNRNGYIRNKEMTIYSKDGCLVYVVASVDYLELSGQNYLLSVLLDITSIKESQLKLSRTRSQLQAILDNLPFMAWFKDPQGKYIEVNRVFELNVEISAKDIIGKTDLDIWPQDLAFSFINDDQQVMTSGKQLNIEEILIINGVERLHSTFKTPVFNECGEITGTTGITRDITEQRELEHDLLKQKNFLKSLIDAAPDLIFYKDTNSIYLGCNSAFAHKAIGIPEEEIIGRTDFDFIKDPELAGFFIQKDQEMLMLNETCMNEETITLADGSVMEAETVKTPFYNEYGEIMGLIGITRDITKRKHAQEQLLLKEKIRSSISAATNELLVNSDFYDAINKCLALLGEATGVDRVYIFENHYEEGQSYTSYKAEWNSGTYEPQIDNLELQNIPFEEIMDFLRPLMEGKAIRGLIKDFGEGRDKELLIEQGIMSILVLPILRIASTIRV